jgi:hypothetical protein
MIRTSTIREDRDKLSNLSLKLVDYYYLHISPTVQYATYEFPPYGRPWTLSFVDSEGLRQTEFANK